MRRLLPFVVFIFAACVNGFSQAPFGNTALLNGTSDFIIVNDQAALRPLNVTLEAWVKFQSLPSNGFAPVISKTLGACVNDSYVIWYINGILNAQVNDINLSNSPAQFSWTPVLNQWYHLAFSYDNTTRAQVLYINGAVVASNTAVIGPDYDASSVRIGADFDNSINLTSPITIDEVRIWNIARNQTQIQSTINTTLTGNESGLAAYYKLDETGAGAGITVTNSATATGAALNGVTVGSPCTPFFSTPPSPTVTGFSPTTGTAGTLVTITGTNFSTFAANNVVKFNGALAVVSSSTATTITVKVPPGATSGHVSVTICTAATSTGNFTVLASSVPTAGMKLWLRADDLTIPNNSPVSDWPDASGLGNDFYGIGTSRPLFKTNGCTSRINGRPYVSYEVGSNLYLSRNDVVGMAPNTSRTFIAVYRILNTSTRAFVIEQGDYSNNYEYIGADANTWMTQGNLFGVYATDNSYDTTTPTDTVYHIHYLAAKTMAIGADIISDLEYRIDDNVQTLNARDLQTGGKYLDFTTAHEMRINGNANIAEVLAFDRVLSTAGRDSVVNYLRAKYSFAPFFPPTVSSFTPTTGTIGTTVTITGTHFDPVPANNIVKFNGVTAVVTASTTTSITTTVPAGATPGPINVTEGCNGFNSLSNFTPTASITFSSQPSGLTACLGTTAQITVGATGTTNIAYQWQKSGVDIADGGDYNGVHTATLNINTTGNFGSGDYRCKVSGDLATPVFSSVATMAISPVPAAPTGTGNSGCPSTPITIQAAGATDGQYRWYTVASGGVAISGEQNSNYATPPLLSTTTYYVAISNGVCESARLPVIATVYTAPAKPAVTGSTSICPGKTAMLTGPDNFTYAWSDGETSQTIAVTQPSTITLTVRDLNGCSSAASDPVIVSCNDAPPTIAEAIISSQIKGSATLDLTTIIQDADNNLDWSSLKITSPPASGANASIDANHQLTVDYINTGFIGTDHLTIGVCDFDLLCSSHELAIEVSGEITVYNAVSPNGDQKNDVLYIQYIDLLPETKNNKVSVFDRWGDKVFETENYDNIKNVFRGLSTGGSELPTGTYYYRISFTSGLKSKTGFISLRR